MKKGFTLIELLVVVAILGILTSVVLASFQSARCKKNKTCKETPCSEYREKTLEDMPARCIQYYQDSAKF